MSVASHRFNNDLRYRDGDHPAQTQLTPEYILTPVRWALGGRIWLDPCTTADNPTGAERFFTVADDGLAQPWRSPVGALTKRQSIFVNPPYGKAREPWVEKCIDAGRFGRKVILLIPAATDTLIFQRALESAEAVVFVRGRVKFEVLRPNRRRVAASHPSALLCWNIGPGIQHLRRLGVVLCR